MNKTEYLAFFKKTIKQMYVLTEKKNNDYAGENDPFRNFKMPAQFGFATVEQGFLTRMVDKVSRISTFVQKGELSIKEESVQDTLIDLATYSILMLAYLESTNIKHSYRTADIETTKEVIKIANDFYDSNILKKIT